MAKVTTERTREAAPELKLRTPEVVTVAPEAETALIEVPIDRTVQPLTWGLHLDLKLTPEQSCAIRRIAAGLDKQQAKLTSGRRVVDPSAAVRYVLEQIE